MLLISLVRCRHGLFCFKLYATVGDQRNAADRCAAGVADYFHGYRPGDAPRGLDSRVPKFQSCNAVLGPVSLRVLGGVAGQAGGKITYEVEGRVVDRGQLDEALLANLRVRPERSVYVSASPQVSYREVAAAVGAAKAAGASTIGLGRL